MDECQQNETPENFQEAQSILNCLLENMNAWAEKINQDDSNNDILADLKDWEDDNNIM